MSGSETQRDSQAVATAWETRFDLDSTAPARARAFLSQVLQGTNRLGDVLLAASELVTNAVVHGDADVAPHVTLRAERRGSLTRVVVEHAGAATIGEVGEPPSPERFTGRGLSIVARVATRMGVATTGGSVKVWFEVEG
jgi:anti-sigma regulatory factor (Ser/Thr protein kinase)